jgi:hypothetical protein
VENIRKPVKRCQYCRREMLPITLPQCLAMLGIDIANASGGIFTDAADQERLRLELYRCPCCGYIAIFVPTKVTFVSVKGKQQQSVDNDQSLQSVLDSLFRQKEERNGI